MDNVYRGANTRVAMRMLVATLIVGFAAVSAQADVTIGGAPDPANANLLTWLSADSGDLVVEDTNLVTQWTDQSAAGNQATQDSGAATRPALTTATFPDGSTVDVVRFAGAHALNLPYAMPTSGATVFIVGHHNQIARGALLLVSDVPTTPEGIKTGESDREVSRKWSDAHLDIGIESMIEIGSQGEQIKHFQY